MDDAARVPVPTLAEAGIKETIDCAKHGVYVWRGDIACVHCGRVYQTTKPRDRFFVPANSVCGCGSPLIADGVAAAAELAAAPKNPTIGADPAPAAAKEPTARKLCHLCFRKIAKRANGRIPNYQPAAAAAAEPAPDVEAGGPAVREVA